jgi:hypothetical protein
MDNRMSATGELLTNHRFPGTGRAGDAAHHSALITCRNRSFSQSSPTLTRI